MSYSRWSTSTWYTFWTSLSESTEFKLPTQRLKNNQIFEICDLPSCHISYEELDELGVDRVIQTVKEFYSHPYPGTIFKGRNEETKELEFEQCTYPAKNPTEEELEELKEYLLEFMYDVDDHFKWKNFFLYEWYYPVRNKIVFWYRNKFKKL